MVSHILFLILLDLAFLMEAMFLLDILKWMMSAQFSISSLEQSAKILKSFFGEDQWVQLQVHIEI